MLITNIIMMENITADEIPSDYKHLFCTVNFPHNMYISGVSGCGKSMHVLSRLSCMSFNPKLCTIVYITPPVPQSNHLASGVQPNTILDALRTICNYRAYTLIIHQCEQLPPPDNAGFFRINGITYGKGQSILYIIDDFGTECMCNSSVKAIIERGRHVGVGIWIVGHKMFAKEDKYQVQVIGSVQEVVIYTHGPVRNTSVILTLLTKLGVNGSKRASILQCFNNTPPVYKQDMQHQV